MCPAPHHHPLLFLNAASSPVHSHGLTDLLLALDFQISSSKPDSFGNSSMCLLTSPHPWKLPHRHPWHSRQNYSHYHCSRVSSVPKPCGKKHCHLIHAVLHTLWPLWLHAFFWSCEVMLALSLQCILSWPPLPAIAAGLVESFISILLEKSVPAAPFMLFFTPHWERSL